MMRLRRVLAEHRHAFGAAAIVVLADLLLYGLAVQPARAAVEQARGRAARAAQERSARTADAGAARARLDAAQRAVEQLRDFRGGVLPRDMAQARDLTYPRLAALAERHGLVLERRTSEDGRDAGGGLGRLQATLRLAGTYGDIRRFVEAVETGPEFLIIESMALSARAAEPGRELVITLDMATYFPAQEDS